MSSSDAGTPPSSRPKSAMAAITSCPGSLVCMSIPSAGAGRNWRNRWRADPLIGSASPAGAGLPSKNSPRGPPSPAEHRRTTDRRRSHGPDEIRPPQPPGPQHGTRAAGVLGLPHDRGPALADSALLAPDQCPAIHRTGPPRPGPAVPKHPGVDRPLRGVGPADPQRGRQEEGTDRQLPEPRGGLVPLYFPQLPPLEPLRRAA